MYSFKFQSHSDVYLIYCYFCIGLGTSTSKEAKEYFSDMLRHRIKFRHKDEQDDHAINLAFSKKAIEQRKVRIS